MLVLSRKLNESIRIGGEIKITLLRVKGNVVRLGIDAPDSVRVVRQELVERDAEAACGQAFARRDGERCGTAIDPANGSRVFVGRLAAEDARGELREEASGEQSAPLRSFLRKSLQATG